MANANKTPNTNPGIATDQLLTDTDNRELHTTSGNIANTKVKDEAIKPGAKTAKTDSAITSVNPAISGADPIQGHAPGEDDAGLSS